MTGKYRYVERRGGKQNQIYDCFDRFLNIDSDCYGYSQCSESYLCDYLNKKRSEGYRLIGLEQTANSRPIQELEWPLKTVLVLGSEGDGIPAHLILQLDECVEIPQSGFVRSLNVHVSGAIAVWECKRGIKNT